MASTWLPLVGVVLLFVTLCWRSWWQHHRYGSHGVLLFRSGRWQERLRAGLGVVLFVALAAQAVVAAVSPHRLEPVFAPDERAAGIWHLVGAAMLFGGIALLVVATLALGASWRIGIEEGSSPGLVTGGIYRFCRNPIYLAIFVTFAGYTLLLPTRLSLALLIGAFIGVRQQVLTEEAYLTRTYGKAYRAYARQVGRFVPGIGRLR